MATPTKSAIIARAKELWHMQEARHGNPAFDIEPEVCELREEGLLAVAQSELMYSDATKYELEQWQGYNAQFEQKNDVSVQKGFSLKTLIDDLKGCLGFVVSSESGHGKSYLGFSVVREAMKPENKTRVICFTPSSVWNRKFGSGISLIKVGTADFSPVVEYDKEEFERLGHGRDTFFLNTDKKYLFKRSRWLEQLLADDTKHLIIQIHYLNSRKTKTFVSECIRLVFERMKAILEQNPEYDRHVLFVLEESQNIYSTYGLNDDASLVTHAILTLSRTDANCHFLALTQRLAEVSVKVTERLRLISGLQVGFNSLNRVRSQIDKKLRHVIQRLPKRTFLYVDGKDNPIFKVPEYKHKGKPTQLLKAKTETQFYHMKPKKKPSRLSKLKAVLKFLFWVDRGDLDKPTSKPFEPEADPLNEVEEEDELPISEI